MCGSNFLFLVLSGSVINVSQDLQLVINISPLHLRDTHFIADHLHRNAFDIILDEAGPAAHSEGEMLLQFGIPADILQQIFQPARGPGENLIRRAVLYLIFIQNLQPGGRKINRTIFRPVISIRVTDIQLRMFRIIPLDMVFAAFSISSHSSSSFIFSLKQKCPFNKTRICIIAFIILSVH